VSSLNARFAASELVETGAERDGKLTGAERDGKLTVAR
jgi:hypothetical protein